MRFDNNMLDYFLTERVMGKVIIVVGYWLLVVGGRSLVFFSCRCVLYLVSNRWHKIGSRKSGCVPVAVLASLD